MHQGDISPAEAYQRLQNNPSAVLVDVRTQPEWVFVGVPAVERLIRLSWQVFPSMQVNGAFVGEIDQMGLPKDAEILCICRSGARSGCGCAAAHAAASWRASTSCASRWSTVMPFSAQKLALVSGLLSKARISIRRSRRAGSSGG